MIPLQFQPTETEHGLEYEIGGVALTFARRAGAWSYSRSDGPRDARLAAPAGTPPRFEGVLAQGETIVRFASPIVLAGQSRSDLWVAWPLEIVVRLGDTGGEVDRFWPGGRQSLIGSVNEGRVLPAVSVAEITAPDDEAVAGLPVAALHIHLENLAKHCATLVRAPVVGEFLTLSQRDGRIAATGVQVTVARDGDAEALTRADDPPPGFERVAAAGVRHGAGAKLAWLLEATRRSVEFPL